MYAGGLAQTIKRERCRYEKGNIIIIMMANTGIKEIKALARQAHSDSRVREQLVHDVLTGERQKAVYSAWALTHLPESDRIHLAAHREALTHIAVTTSDTSLRRLTLALLERLSWNLDSLASVSGNQDPPRCYMELLDCCFARLMQPDEAPGVRSLCMKLAYKLSLPYPELLGELRQCLLMLEPATLSAGVIHTRNKLLKLINP